MNPLRLGRIPFLHMRPHNAALAVHPALREVAWMDAPPAELNRMLASGELDGAPASSIEYAQHPGRYRLLADFSVSNSLAVPEIASVLLLARGPRKRLEDFRTGDRIQWSSASATSVALLRILLGGKGCVFEPVPSGNDPLASDAAGVMVIGDAALACHPEFNAASRLREEGWSVIDLGAEWTRHSKLPMVFALYIVREEAAQASPASFAALSGALAGVRPTEYPAALVSSELPWINAKALERYWSGIHYRLGEAHRAGLLAFYRAAAEAGLIPAVPSLRFV